MFYEIDIERHQVRLMAYENRNAAYDLSLFDDSSDYVPGSAAPERKEEVHKKQERKKLNQEVITAKETLANAQSVYTQTQMKLESKLSTSDIEKYAEDKLGMTKATNTQKEFVTLAGGDKAEVSASQESDNLFTQFWSSVQNLWS